MISPSKVPFLLSAFACPGAGQFIQKRWLAGTLYGAGFIVGFCWFMVLAGRIIYSYYRLAFDLDYSPEDPDIFGMLPPFIISIVFYIANLFDVVFAQQRLKRKSREDEVLKEFETAKLQRKKK